ncbi:hypothetical protein [Clostridium sp. HV4-5-A1G]|uniref:hypothetical protein n=1 Tax=Clostridium sp. HV4-5-A1G TaxID=2004595 RepID=UPI00123A3A7D|nr:hypothetical protein [Clostridium sp. HV4-5-A1G]KAA8674467.1 hypothetical protein F3O63_07725 [Clostridium sp. HV4-5-A1G]
MSKHKRNNYQSFESHDGRYTRIFDDMIDSAAWDELSGNAIKLYIKMKRKYVPAYDGKGQLIKCNKDDISMPKSEYSKFMSPNTFQKCIDELISCGFIRVVEYKPLEGSRKVIIYGFSDMWQKYGTKDFVIKDEWKRAKNKNYI